MKKWILFSVVLFAAAIAAHAQSIPNGDFESWNSKVYSNPDSSWYTSNDQTLAVDDSLTVWKVAGIVGQAIHIQTAIVGTDTLGAYITNSNGDPRKGIGGMPYTQKPTALVGFYRCNIMTGDSGAIIVLFKNSGTIIAAPGKLAFTGSTSTFTAFTIPIPALPLTPDTVIIAATSSNLINNNIGLKSGSWLELDQLTFTGTGITEGIVNGSFDAWVSNTFDLLTGWHTQPGGQRGNGVTKISSGAYSGSYAVMLQTLAGDNNPNTAQVCNGLFTKNSGPHGGLPYTKTADTLTGYYKYTAVGTDTGQIFVELSKSGSNVGGNTFYCLPKSTWTYFQIPFSASSTPDTILVDLVSSSWNTPNVGSMLYLDKVQLKSQPLNVNIINSGAGIVSIYPNPVNDVLHLKLNNKLEGTSELKIVDMSGKVVFRQNFDALTTVDIPVHQLSAGIYFYEINNNGAVIHDKFTKQ